MARALLLVFLVLCAFMARAADYAREKMWENEILDSLVVGDAVYLDARQHRFLSLHTPARNPRGALILVHGIGIHPDWGLIGVLRRRLADDGYTTLSIQMPVLARDSKAGHYSATFDEAAARLQSAVDYLKSKGYRRIAIVSHSLGSRMTNYYLVRRPDAAVAAWVAIGMPGPFDRPAKLRLPVADVFGERDLPVVLDHRAQRKRVLAGIRGARQIPVPYADHFFTGREDELAGSVRGYLDSLFAPAPAAGLIGPAVPANTVIR